MKQYVYVSSTYKELLIKEADGKKRVVKVSKDFQPTIYVPGMGGYRSLDGKDLMSEHCKTLVDFRSIVKKMKSGNNCMYGQRYPEYQYIQEEHTHRENYDSNVPNVLYFDIETERSEQYGYAPPSNPFNRVTLITSFFPKTNEKCVFALKENPIVQIEGVEYFAYNDEIAMISAFFEYMNEMDIDIITGWNINNYDIPFLCGRLLGQYKNPGNNTDGNYEPGREEWDCSLVPFLKIKRSISHNQYGEAEVNYNIPGIEALDYMHLYKKFTYITRESYSLNHISYCELGDKKVDYSEHQHLQSLYEQDYQKFVEYGVKDTVLVYRLEEKLKLINLAITMAYMIGCNFSDVFSPVKTWEILLYNKMMEKYIVPPMLKKGVSKNDQYIGAFVKEPVVGKHKWVVSYDLNSLYPHIMMFANMSPETHISRDKMGKEQGELYDIMQYNVKQSVLDVIDGKKDLHCLKDWDVCITPNGAMFSRKKQGILPQTVKWLYSERKKAKKEMLKLEQDAVNGVEGLDSKISSLNAKQMALKILSNSAYGACGNAHFLFYNLDIAEGITSMGQVAIRYIGNELESYLTKMFNENNRLIYTDTDSCYLTLEDFVNKLKTVKPDITDDQIATAIDKFSNEKIEPFIEECYEKLRDYLNGYEQSLKMKREKIAPSSIFVAKKRYTTAIIDDEGVRLDKIKVKTTGLESVRSSTPEAIREKLRELEEIMLLKTDEDVHNFLSEMRRNYNKYKIQDIAIVKSVNDIEKWVTYTNKRSGTINDTKWRYSAKTGTPLQVRAAALYNVIMMNRDEHAETIKSGDKLHLVYIKGVPGYSNEYCIAYPQVIPEELGLTKDMVDWDTMYEKTFLSAAQILMNAVGLQARNRTATNLSDFFS